MDELAKAAAAFRAAIEQTPSDRLPIGLQWFSRSTRGDATELLGYYLKTHGDPDQDRLAYEAKQALRAPFQLVIKPSGVLLSRALYGTQKEDLA